MMPGNCCCWCSCVIECLYSVTLLSHTTSGCGYSWVHHLTFMAFSHYVWNHQVQRTLHSLLLHTTRHTHTHTLQHVVAHHTFTNTQGAHHDTATADSCTFGTHFTHTSPTQVDMASQKQSTLESTRWVPHEIGDFGNAISRDWTYTLLCRAELCSCATTRDFATDSQVLDCVTIIFSTIQTVRIPICTVREE